jgi:tetratricopeptide (TPR) repeat protein
MRAPEAADRARPAADRRSCSQGGAALSSKTILVPRTPRQGEPTRHDHHEDSLLEPPGGLPEVPGYHLHHHVASGGMGVVYAATSLATRRKVALKLVHPDLHDASNAERILREARALTTLAHPGIVQYVDHGVTERGIPYLAMEWLDGVDLETRLRDGPLSLEDSLALTIRVAEALAAAHGQGVIHRDIKPANILLVDGRPEDARLLDFGVARLADRNATLTLPGRIIGTPAYMSPEQARGAADLDARSDLFSLGCVLYECASGEPAFAGEHVVAVLAKVLMESPPRLRELVPGLPTALDELVARLLEKDPARRIGSARELALRLRGLGPGRTEPPAVVPEALTRDEQALRSVLLCRGRPDTVAPPVDLARLADEHHGYHVTLADGTRLIVMDRGGEPSDQAATAARCALRLREQAPWLAIAVASGLGLFTGREIVGQVLDRGAALLSRATPGRIHIDDVTASLLDASFELEDDDGGPTLVVMRAVQPGARRLMGKTTPLVGRGRELAFLEAAFDECVQGRCASAIAVVADAGVGKSRLRDELDARLRARPGAAVTTLIGRADPLRAQAPFSLLAQVLHGAAGLDDGAAPLVRRRALHTRIARHVAPGDVDRVALYLGELLSAFPDDAPLELELARHDATVMRARIEEAWCTWLRAESDACPVLFVLEDLHWADAATAQVMDAALEVLRGSPVLVLALARPSVRQRFPALWKQRELQVLELPPLPDRAARQLVQDVLGPEVEPSDVERIVAGARGNAFFLEELIRAFASRTGAELPDSVLGMMQARLGALSAAERQVLRAASVFGQTAWRGGIAALLGAGAEVEALDDALARLVDAEWLSPCDRSQIPGQDEYCFRHALVSDVAYASLTDVDRPVGHRLAGRWLERMGGQEAVVLAGHFQLGEDHARAAEWFATAADRAFQRHELDVVRQLAERGLLVAGPGRIRGRLLQRRAEVQALSGHHQEATATALAALEELPADDPRWYVTASEAALAMGRSGQTTQVLEIVDRLIAREPSGMDAALSFVEVARAALPLAAAGQAATAVRLLDKIIGVTSAMAAADLGVVGHMHSARALRALVASDPATSYRELAAATDGFKHAGRIRDAIEHMAAAGFFLIELGGLERGEAILRRTIERSTELRLEHVAAVARHNLGRRIAEALDLEHQALASFERHGNQRMTGLTHCHIAAILLEARRPHDAAAHVDAALERLHGHPASRSLARATRARIRMALGEPALDDAEAAIRDLEALDLVQEGESLVRLTFAEALAAAGRMDEARAAILAAERSLEERAERIDDEALRTSFRLRLPENARISQLAREWHAVS